MTNIDRWPEAFQDGIPKAGGRWSWNRRAITVKSPMVSGECAVLFDDGMKTTWTPKDFAYDGIAFLGFSDPPAQGVSVPQKMLFKKGDRVRLADSRAMGAQVGAPATVTEDYDPNGYLQVKWDDGPLRQSQSHGGYFPQDFERIESAPIAAPPPSLKAAVQQEGLTIPPQAGTRHEFWETFAQAEEGGQNYKSAKESRAKAQAVLAADLAYDVEADAIREGRTVLKAALKEMGQGDRRCFDLRGLREFEAIRSAEHPLYFWWAR